MANGVGSAAGRSKRDQMPKQIRLNAFDMNCVAHQSPGLWTHPRDRADRYNTLDYWVELAKLLERGKFDALFLADVLGVYDVYRGSPDAAIANAVQVPVNDPLLLIPAMAYVTSNLGFGVNLRGLLRTSVYASTPVFDARSSDRRPHRLECGHRISQQRRQGHRACAPAGARHALRNRRRIHAGGPHATRVRVAGEGASHPTRRQVFPDRSDSPLRTLAAADTADLSGRRVFLRGKMLTPFGVYPL